MNLLPLPSASLLAAVLMFSGCTRMQPIDLSPTEVQQQVRSGELLSPGDYAKFTVADGQIHEFRVETIDRQSDAVTGDGNSVQIAEIVAVETMQTGTAGKVGGAVSVFALAFLVIGVGSAASGPF